MSGKVKIGFVGVGMMGQCAHLKNYAGIPECEVVAIAEVREDLREKVAARYGVPRTYRTHVEMFENEKLDGIVSAQWFNRHGVIIPELLKAGVPVFTEKPLACSLEAGEKILKAVKDSGTWHMLGYHKRSDPAVMWVMDEIARLEESGELGKMKYIRLSMPSGDWTGNGLLDMIHGEAPGEAFEVDSPPADMDEETLRVYDGVVNVYVHQVNLMRHLLGESYKVTYADPQGVVIGTESDSGIPGIIELNPYTTTIDWQESAMVCFEKGYIKIDFPAPLVTQQPARVEVLRDPGDAVPLTITPKMPLVHAMRQQAINFIAAIKGERKPPCDTAEALEDLKMVREYIRLLKGV